MRLRGGAQRSRHCQEAFLSEWEQPLEPERAVTSEVRRIRGTSQPVNISAADSGFETSTTPRAVVGASRLSR